MTDRTKKDGLAAGRSVLIADDDPVTLKLLDHQLRSAGFETRLASDGAKALERLDASVSLAIFDLQMPELDGIECLKRARERFPDLPVLIISQAGEIRSAVEAIKQGAFEFISKPIDPDELLARLRQAENAARLSAENRQLRRAVEVPSIEPAMIGKSEFSRWLTDRCRKIAGLDSTVLITGESGTGKTTVARMIHHLGPRRSGPFVAVSCAALPRDLIEAELFGHVRGAFTGAISDRPGRAEMADGGTLFLDEIGDLPLELQPKLLTFLQDRVLQRIGETQVRKVDVRVIAATHQDLEEKVQQHSFRQDLYFRLAVLTLEMKPLRDRSEDVLVFAEHILSRIASQRRERPFEISPEAVKLLEGYSWPGNIRELENVLERGTAFCESAKLEPDDLGLCEAEVVEDSSPISLAGQTLDEIERRAIIDTLSLLGGNKKGAAKMLGIDEKSIYNKMRRLGITDPKGGPL
jgi:DNA-binding NtrC family response regulator